ncbi:conserved hypothetical protein of the DUF1841 family [Candidatus Kinetoplastibacterium oncopeltii TCC290E]|uniref:DUF1841 family protein n=1 Tax=Candidatus Kinetoplastidibacterium stringomonadis TCC290E TaxID=1208920 RepID=M1M963_9PROT|nr:DUF1841 family protein [Candidatus Kinetoplastibacterium oncopeltii]AGF48510.1 conserved hypothetical protein of the DUF1841 family [Candidatus Kinetoplastibacterium oncopeltii TCC290E]
MFNPSLEQARSFFIEVWNKQKLSKIMTPIEEATATWILEHPQFHADLSNKESIKNIYNSSCLESNPFLHLSMHLAVSEQLLIDQPCGIKAAYNKLVISNNPHTAAHKIIKCLKLTIKDSQNYGIKLDSNKYLMRIKEMVSKS